MSKIARKTVRSNTIHSWDNFVDSSVGGFQLYELLCHEVVTNAAIPIRTAASVRMLNKSFRQHIDAEIPDFMAVINQWILEIYKTQIEYARIERTPRYGANTEQYMQWTLKQSSTSKILNTSVTKAGKKLGSNNALYLKKCISEHVSQSSNLRTSDLGWMPNPEHDVPRFAETVHSFLMFSSDNICELNIGKSCKCGSCKGHFSFVPSGRGLLMRCSKACMNEVCVIVNTQSTTPLKTLLNNSEREKNLLENVLIQGGIVGSNFTSPTEINREDFKRMVSEQQYTKYLDLPTRRLNSLLSKSKGVKILLLDTNAIKEDKLSADLSFRVPTLQHLLRIDDEKVGRALSFMKSSDDIIDNVKIYTKKMMKKFATAQIVDLLNEYLRHENINPCSSISEIEDSLPGISNLIHRSVIAHVENTSIDYIHSTHVMGRQFTLVLLKLASRMLGTISTYDVGLYEKRASNFAYSYVSGICAGMDASFNVNDLFDQLNRRLENCKLITDQLAISSASKYEIDRDRECKCLLASMHVFDDIDYKSVKVNLNFEYKSEQEYRKMSTYLAHASMVFEVEFIAAGKKIYIPLALKQSDSVDRFQRKKEAAEKLLLSHNYNVSGLIEVPNLSITSQNKRVRSGAARQDVFSLSDSRTLASWLTYTTSHLCSILETRSIGLDLLTNDNTTLFVSCIEEQLLGLD